MDFWCFKTGPGTAVDLLSRKTRSGVDNVMRFLLETFRENPHLTSPDPWAKSQLSSDELNCWLGTLMAWQTKETRH